MKKITTYLGAAALIAILIFSIQNLEAVKIRFLFWSVSVSQVLVIVGSYLLGMLSGWSLLDFLKRSITPSPGESDPQGK